MLNNNLNDEKLEDSQQLIEEDSPINIPDGLSLFEVCSKAKKWNAGWKPFYEKKKINWENNYRMFRHFDKGLVENVTTRVYEIWANIQTEIPHLVNSIFTKSEVVKPSPKSQEPMEATFKIKKYINNAILVQNDGRKIATDALQDFLVFGTIISKTFWDNEKKNEFSFETQEWKEVYEGKPSMYNVDIFDFAIDPTFRGHDCSKAEWVRERLYFKKEELKKLMEAGEIESISDNELADVKSVESGKEIRDKIDGIAPVKDEKNYVDEFWATLYWKDPQTEKQKSGKFYFWLLNDNKIIKFKKNIFGEVPYIVARCYRLTHEFYGVGDVDVMASLGEHINVIHAQASLMAKKTGQKLTLHTAGAGLDAQQMKRKENGILLVKDLSQIRTEDTTAGKDMVSLMQYKDSIKYDLSNAVGVNDILRGEQQGDSTATEASIANSNASARLALKLQNFQSEYVVPCADKFYNLSKQFIDTYSLYVDNSILDLTQADFQGSYDWIPVGSISQSNKNLRIRQLTEISMQIVGAVQASMQSNGTINFPAFDLGGFYQKEILPLFEIEDSAQYFASPQQIQQPQQAGINPDLGLSPEMVNNALPNINSSGPLPLSEGGLQQGNLEGNLEVSASSIV